MRIHYGFDDIATIDAPVVTLGSFDGVHGGHRALLDAVKRIAAQTEGRSVVMTFEPHPRIALGTDKGLSLLTTVEEKAILLERAGIDDMIVVPFDSRFSSQSHDEFIRNYMIDKLHIRGLVIGYNHRFGRGNEGNFDTLSPLAAQFGFTLHRVEQYTDDSAKVSSTVIRRLIGSGDMNSAVRMLTHPYIIKGVCCNGRIAVTDRYKLLPPSGRYAGRIDGEETRIVVDGRVITADIEDKEAIIEFI
ncbi:MAG: FAD synthetase [Alistipes sp.]|nr:FAD synthetase [Alistipes sp.]